MEIEGFSGEVVAAASQNIKERDYWLKKLGGKFERSFFPYDYPQTIHDGKMDKINFIFPDEIFPRFIKLSKGLDYTLHMILLSGIIGILGKYTASNDIIVGAPIYKQKDEGRFINTLLVLRHQTDEAVSFKELLLLVRKTLIEATEHQNYPLETLLYKLNIEHAEGEFPLFDIAILLENIHDKKYIQGIDLNMIFSFLRTGNSLEGTIEYNPQRYLKASVERYIGHLLNFFKEALVNIDMQMDNIQILTEAEKRQLIYDFNDTASEIAYLQGKTIHSLFSDQVKKTPGNLAVKAPSYYTPTLVEGETLTYETLARKVNQLADVLVKKGITNGDIVGIIVKRSLEMIVGMLAILKTGAAYLPIDSEYPGSRINYILRDSKAKMLLTQSRLVRSNSNEIETLCIDLDSSFYNADPSPWETGSKADEIAYIIYTSGSTGKPKGVMVEHRSITNTLYWRKNCYRFDANDRVMQIPSFSFDSSVEDIFTPLISGSGLVLLLEENRYNVEYIRTLIEKNSITHFLIVPGFYKILLTEIPQCLKRLRCVTVAGEGFTEALVNDHFSALPNVKLYNEYGPTENSVCSTVYEFDVNNTKVLIGKPITNVSCYIRNARGILAPVGVHGELCVSGKGLARGYLNNPELTADRFVKYRSYGSDKTYINYKTGDLARWKPDGNIEYSGRSDHQVKIRGFRIELGEIEERLLKLETVKEAVVLVKEDKNSEKYICAYLVSDAKINTPVLKDCLGKDLPDYMIPSKFIQLPHLPRSVNGKVDRNALPEPEIDAGEEYIPPRNELERKLIGLWADVLGVEPELIGIDSNFFDLGGHSLSATVLVSRIHKEFNIKLPLKELFKSSTVRLLGDVLKESRVKEEFVSIEPVEEKEYYPVSSAQNRFYILQQMDVNLTAYNVPLAIELAGEVDKEKLEDTFRKLIDRHESLRTSFLILNGKPVQKLHREVEFKIEYFDTFEDETMIEGIVTNLIRPFNLSAAPLLRVGLIKINSLRQILMMDFHHIITDGVSHSILITDFMSLYNTIPLPQLNIQYKDYLHWLKSDEVQNTLLKQEGFWLKEFEGELPLLILPIDYRRPPVQSFEGNTMGFDIPEEETAALNELAQSEGATLFMVLMAIYNIFLFKLSNQEDIIIGTPIAGRRHADLEKIVGLFINTLILRNYPAGEKSFKLFLREIKEKTIKVFENQDYQFEELIEKIVMQRNMSRNPLFDVLFVLQNMSDNSGDILEKGMGSLKIKPYAHENRTAKFDLTLNSMEADGKLYIFIEYCSKLFKNETISRFIQYFKSIVTSVLGNLAVKISEIEIISAEEKKQLLFDFNNTAAEYPTSETLQELFANQAAKTPDRVAVVGTQGLKEVQEITYRELNEKSNRLAARLQEKGLTPNSIIGILMDRSVEMIITILGIIKSGSVYLPIELNYPQGRIEYMLKDSCARILINKPGTNSNVQTINDENKNLKDLLVLNYEQLGLNSLERCPHCELQQANLDPSNLAYIIYTSGSTGNPKGVLIRHRSVVNMVWFHRKVFKENPGSRISQAASAVFDAMAFEVWPCLLTGACLCIIDNEMRMQAVQLKEWLIQLQVTISFQPTLIAQELLREQWPETGVSLKALRTAGDRLTHHPTHPYPFRFYNLYGPTEDTIWTTWTEVPVISPMEENYPPSIGKPVANHRVNILNSNLTLQPVGVQGELCISGVGLAEGYLNNPELTAERFYRYYGAYKSNIFSFYKTGDLARWLSDGSIEFLGRIDHQIKIRGFRIELGEIESRLLQHGEIKEATVIEKESKTGNIDLYAYLVTSRVLTTPELREYLGLTLPAYMIPSYFVSLEKMPITPGGKVDKKVLAAIVPDMNTGKEFVPAQTDLQKNIVGIWQEVLELPSVSIMDNFFDLGGNSLKLINLNSKLNETLGMNIPVVEMFKYTTIEAFVNFLENKNTVGVSSVEDKKKVTENLNKVEGLLHGAIGKLGGR
ncbi:MAG TPA: amino acid adenylation domain-containing protein [Candidatus Kapabacteria bacterium]|nr:amino acid adenylation domain-containing protein [Candidatus Kapabacteria bacterium]